MAIEQIRKIKEVEDQADQIRKKSQADAKQMAADAEKEAFKLQEDARRESEEQVRRVLAEAEKRPRRPTTASCNERRQNVIKLRQGQIRPWTEQFP